MNRLTLGTECKKGHDLTLPNAIYTSSDPDKIVRRCRACWQEYQRNLQRKKRGTPLDAPVRAYTPRNPRGSQTARKQLMELLGENPELVPILLVIAREHTTSNSRAVVLEALSPAYIH